MYIYILFAQSYIGFQKLQNLQSQFYLDRILTHIELMHGIEKHQILVFFSIFKTSTFGYS